MWHEINDKDDLRQFRNEMHGFHDSIIKEIKYLSGAYIDENLLMYPINDRGALRVLIQRQYEVNSMIELEFCGLKCLKLYPVDEKYTCEIIDSTMLIKDGYIYWCDCGGLTEETIEDYSGMLVCGSKLRWRAIENQMGNREFYCAVM